MSDVATNIQRRAQRLDVSPEFDGYSKVIINVGKDDDGNPISYISGNDSGRILEFDCPWGTQAMANNILSSMRGFQYQPYDAPRALLDPAAELGDGITINGVYSGLYRATTTFGRLMSADISAPQEEAIDHEFPYKSSTQREITRLAAETKAEFKVTATNISAKVSKVGGDNRSFGWNLSDNDWTLSANGQTVLKATQSGLEVYGRITATSGYIGDGSAGFTIKASSISNGVTSLNDTSHYGIYIGTDGIRLGKGAFTVDNAGNVTASSLIANNATLTGTLMVGGKAITANDLQYGAQLANDTGGYWSGGAAGGYDFKSMGNPWSAYPINASLFMYNGYQLMPQTIAFIDGNGNTRSFEGVLRYI